MAQFLENDDYAQDAYILNKRTSLLANKRIRFAN